MLANVFFCPLASVSWAQENNEQSPTSPVDFKPPELPDNQRPDGRSRGGASRNGACLPSAGQSPLTALVPTYPKTNSPETVANDEETDVNVGIKDVSAESVFSLTTKEHPSFWFYIPYELDKNSPVTFALTDRNQAIFYQTTFEVSTTEPGIIQIPIPSTQSSLLVGKQYQWFFLVACNDNTFDELQGWISRIDLDRTVRAQMAPLASREQAMMFAEHGIWQDALSVFGKQYQMSPQDTLARQDWLTLLESVGLNDISSEKILDCCRESLE